MYKQIKDNFDNILNSIFRIEDNAFIPFAEDNTDYIAYLAWLAEGNTPLPADKEVA